MEKKGMTRTRVALLGVIAFLVLFAPAQAQFEPTIEIIPPEPTSADDVAVKVGVWLGSPCEKATFSELNRWDNVYDDTQVIFWATVIVEPAPPGAICPTIIVPVSHTYHLGKLELGDYYFVLYACVGEEGVCRPWTIEELDGVRFHVSGAIEKIIDRNGNCYIDDDEILWAVELWIEGEKIPGTSRIIDDATILRLIHLWVTGAEIC